MKKNLDKFFIFIKNLAFRLTKININHRIHMLKLRLKNHFKISPATESPIREQMKTEKKSNNEAKAIIISISIGMILIVIFYASFLALKIGSISEMTLDDAGVFGDSFGFLTSIFSALAFIGVIYTNILQRNALEIQRREIELQKNELETSRNEERKKSFENTFFQLIKNLHQTLGNVRVSEKGGIFDKDFIYGLPALELIHQRRRCNYKEERNRISEMKRRMKEQGQSLPDTIFNSEIFLVMQVMTSPQYTSNLQIDNHFKNIEIIIIFIAESSLKEKDIDLYVNILKMQLSPVELIFVFYYSIVKKNKTLKNLVKKYSICDELVQDQLYDYGHVESLWH